MLLLDDLGNFSTVSESPESCLKASIAQTKG